MRSIISATFALSLAGFTASCALTPAARSTPVDSATSSNTKQTPSSKRSTKLTNRPDDTTKQLEPWKKLPPPIPPPDPGPNGCISAAQLSQYAKALEDLQSKADARAMAELGAQTITRAGFFLSGDGPNVDLGEVYEANGKRYAVVAIMDSYSKPDAVLGKTKDGELHLIDSQARSHQVVVRACGTNECSVGRGAKVWPRPVAIELEPGESIGENLEPFFDFWWVMADYTDRRDCGPPPP